MPRPSTGYRNNAGMVIPGTSDITGRFMDRSRLLYWAFNRGKTGAAKLYDDSALNIGTAVHMMAELDLKNRPRDDIDYYLENSLTDREDRAKAEAAFRAFRQWREDFHVRAHAQEVSLVSEKLQFGGTLDTVAVIRNGLGLVDFKTSASGEVYEDHVLQLAAYGILWNETYPDEPLTQGYHLIVLPKDGSKPVHREWTEESINPYRQKFWLYRKAYDLDKVCNNPKTLAGSTVAPSVAPAKAARKPRAKASVHLVQPSMAEILRSYGHVGAGAGA
jgi:hypothetical protein